MRKGMARMIEAVISAVLIIGAFSVSYYLLIPPSASQIRSNEALVKYGHNVLSSLASNNGFEILFTNYKGKAVPDWEQELKIAVNSLMAPKVIFNLTVYKVTRLNGINGFIKLNKINRFNIQNVMDPMSFIKAGETAQVTYVYTMKNMTTLVFDMRMANLGGM